ncbi:unnamed protein product [Ascophyllum nodosum]
MRFFSRSGDSRGRWSATRRNTSPSSGTGPADTFPNSPSISPTGGNRSNDLWDDGDLLPLPPSTPGDAIVVASGGSGTKKIANCSPADGARGGGRRRKLSEGFGAAMAAAGRAPLKAPPPFLHVPQRNTFEGTNASRRASPATSATGSAMSVGSNCSPADDRSDGDASVSRTRKGRRRRQLSGNTRGRGSSSSPSWAEASEWADQQVGPDRTMGAPAPAGSSTRTTPVGGGTSVDDRTPIRRRTPVRSSGTPPVATGAGLPTPPLHVGITGAPGAVTESGFAACNGHLAAKSLSVVDNVRNVEGFSPEGSRSREDTNRTRSLPCTCGAPQKRRSSATSAIKAVVTGARNGFSAGEGGRVAPPPPINTATSKAPIATVRTPPMVRPPPPRTTAPSPPAPPPPSQRAPSPPAGGDTGGGPRRGGGGGGLRAPEPPPVQAPLPPTSETRDRDGSSEWRWTSMAGGRNFLVPAEGNTLAESSEGLVGERAGLAGLSQQRGLAVEGLGMGIGLGLDLVGLAQGQGQGAPEGFRPPRLRMFSNPGTLSNPGGSRAAVLRYNDKRLSYKFSDKGALTLKNYGIRIGRGGIRDYSEEVLSPTGQSGNGTVGPFFSSSGGGDHWVEVPPDAMSTNVVRLEELGHGATGCVYKAVHATSLQLLAVKEVPVHDKNRRDQIGAELRLLKHCRADVATRQEREKEEATRKEMEGDRGGGDSRGDSGQTSNSAGSPSSLVTFYDAFTLTRSGYVSIVMEYCSGGSLQDLITSRGPLTEASIASIALDIAQGLHYMHSLNMLHRDIKPANILIDGKGRVKLADFGLVRSLYDSDTTSNNASNPTGAGCGPDGSGTGGRRASRGRAHSFAGTAIYMSPERLQGEPYGPAADVWSLGLTLLTLAIGKYPLEIPKNNLYWNLVKLVCPQISSFQSGFSTSGHSIASFGGSRGSGENLDAGNPTPAVTPGTTPGNPRGSGVFPAAHQLPREFSRGESVADGAEPATSPPFAEVFRSVPRFSRRDPMSVFLPPERAEQLRLSRKFLSFLTACLKYDAEKRITAREMLEHPFLQVPPSERGVSLAQRRKAVGNAAPGVRVQSRRDKALSRGDKTPPQRDGYVERVSNLASILSAVAKFHINNIVNFKMAMNSVRGSRRRTRSSSYFQSGHERVSIGNGGNSGGGTPGIFPSTVGNSGIQGSLVEPLTSAVREKGELGVGRDAAAALYGLRSILEPPVLEDGAYERLAEHVGVLPVVVEAVWRDEWVRHVEQQQEAILQEEECDNDNDHDNLLEATEHPDDDIEDDGLDGEPGDHLSGQSFLPLADLPKMTMPLKLDE